MATLTEESMIAAINRGIEQAIERAVEDEIQAATKRFEEQLRKDMARIVLGTMTYYEAVMDRRGIVITVRSPHPDPA